MKKAGDPTLGVYVDHLYVLPIRSSGFRPPNYWCRIKRRFWHLVASWEAECKERADELASDHPSGCHAYTLLNKIPIFQSHLGRQLRLSWQISGTDFTFWWHSIDLFTASSSLRQAFSFPLYSRRQHVLSITVIAAGHRDWPSLVV